MSLQIIKTTDPQNRPPVVMLVYGAGGVGKTTFATTALKPLIIDCEGGTKYLGLRGINVDTVRIKSWSDMKEVVALAKDYDTIVIDPIGELMDKLKAYMISMNNSKFVQKDGSPTMAGWGFLKDTLRSYFKILRDTGKHVLLIAHVAETKDDERIVKRPMLATKLSEEIVNMVDIVGFMQSVGGSEENPDSAKRAIFVDADSDKYIAKDRTGRLGNIIPPDFSKIIEAVSGSEVYAWSSDKAKAIAETKAEEKPEAPAVEEEVKDLLKKAKKTNTPLEVQEEPKDKVLTTDEVLKEMGAQMN